MSYEVAKEYLDKAGFGDRIKNLEQSSATVELAANALGCDPERIAKTLSFIVNGKPILVVAAGDAKIDNKKYKGVFHCKAVMISGEHVEGMIGHAPGGVCPFGVKPDVKTYLDVSLKRFETVYPACGSANSAVELSIDELEKLSNSESWIDV